MVGIFSLCMLLFVVALPFVASLSAWIILRRGGMNPVTTPSCGACRAPIGADDGLQCPRCGADTREVGLLTPTSQRRITPMLAVLIWSGMMTLPAFLLLVVGFAAAPRQYQFSSSNSYSPNDRAQVQSLSVRASGRTIEWPWESRPRPRPHDEASITITFPSGVQTSLEIDYRDGTYRYTVTGQGEKLGRGQVTQDAVLQWWRDVGATAAAGDANAPADRDVSALAADVATIAQSKATNAPPNPQLAMLHSTGGGSGSGSGPVMWFPLGALLLAAAVWIVGCVVVARRSRR